MLLAYGNPINDMHAMAAASTLHSVFSVLCLWEHRQDVHGRKRHLRGLEPYSREYFALLFTDCERMRNSQKGD